MFDWQELIDSIVNGPKYKRLYKDGLLDLRDCQEGSAECVRDIALLQEQVARLELVATRPSPPRIKYIVEKDSAWIQSVIEGIGANIVRLPLGNEFRLTSKSNFLNVIAWDWVDTLEYRKQFRCGNFAISFKAHVDQYFGLNQVGIVLDYVAGHAYNVIIFADGKHMLLEPQSDNLFYWEDVDLPFYVLKGAFVII